MKYAYNHWRREFRGPGEENCSGILVWQLNDIWPGTSWALVDVEGHMKPSFYITKRALAKVVVGMERVVTEVLPYMPTSYLPKREKVEIWGVNGYTEPLQAVLRLKAFDIESGKELELAKGEEERKITLKPNQATELSTIHIPNSEQTVIVAYIEDSAGKQLARWVSWPEPLKYVRFSKETKVDISVEGDKVVVVKSNRPVKGVVLGVKVEEGEEATFEDNFVDLVPGEEIGIEVKGLNGRLLEARFLGDWELKEGFVL